MRPEDYVSDLIVDLIGGRSRAVRENLPSYKVGDLASRPYILGRNPNRTERRVITEAYLLSKIRLGEKRISLGSDVIITPLARLLIEEGRIKVYE
ncbi:MAG: hypothetical protein GX817_02185 [Elusimicrobia bacterium]|nr:hypothetical protein [Elusimicrobiota bacterium]